MSAVPRAVSGAVAVAVLLLAMDMLGMVGGVRLLDRFIRLETHYYFALLTLLLPSAFLLFPRQRLLDPLLAAVAVAAGGYCFAHAEAIVDEGWEFGAPPLATWLALAAWAALLEAVRRAGGWGLFLITAVFSLMPLVADRLPGPFAGLPSDWAQTAAYHVLSLESIFGLPFRAFAELVIGFVIFGLALQHTGGGRFFLDLAFGLLGHVRGGAAKVALVSSGLMGSMSGSVVTNVLTTGQLTIPAMKSSGMRPETAAGVEACASTGGVLLPPIMGSTAFVMASFLQVPYYEVAVAAAIPSLLYFAGLFMQIDAHAAVTGLRGLPRSEMPSVRRTLLQGWYYLGAFAALVVLLLVLQREAVAPYYATGALLILNQLSRQHRWNFKRLVEFLQASGRLLTELFAVLAGVGLIVGALSLTGLSGTLVNDMLFLAGDSLWLLLLMGALTSFVLGIGMTVTAAYIFLAIVLAPALIQGGLDPMAVHLFILYWAMLSFITPPVALGAFAAASIAGARPLRTGLAAMRLGAVIYVIPFMFVLQPGLLAGEGGSALWAVPVALLALGLLAGAVQGYLPWVGGNWVPWQRVAVGFGALLVALPPLAPQLLPGGRAGQVALGIGIAGLAVAVRILRSLRSPGVA